MTKHSKVAGISSTAVEAKTGKGWDAWFRLLDKRGARKLKHTAIAALLEWQRDWARREHYNNLMTLIKAQGGAYGAGVEYAYTMVHKAPQSAQKPQVVAKKSKH